MNMNDAFIGSLIFNKNGSGGASALEDLSDINITAPQNGQALIYDEDSEKWVNGQGGGGDHVTLTQAEYDALVQAGTVDPNAFYFISDTNGDGQDFQPVIYSTEEREIGVWTDGKPLYEKTIDLGTLPYNAPKTVAHNIGNIDIVVYASGTAYNSTSQVSLPIPYVSGGSSTYNIDINTNSTYVTVSTYTDRSAFVGYIKLQYTKSTDTPGSGTWTPQGVPAVHYSTDEQVVGTWIDGSTIYEKTFNIQKNAEQISNTLFSDLQIKMIIDLYLMLYAGHVLQKSLNISYDDSTNKLTINEGTKYVQFITVRYTKSSS